MNFVPLVKANGESIMSQYKTNILLSTTTNDDGETVPVAMSEETAEEFVLNETPSVAVDDFGYPFPTYTADELPYLHTDSPMGYRVVVVPNEIDANSYTVNTNNNFRFKVWAVLLGVSPSNSEYPFSIKVDSREE